MPTSLHIVLAQINPRIGDLSFNIEKIKEAIDLAEASHQTDLVVFPELALSGYPPEDLLLRQDFLTQVAAALHQISEYKPHLYIILGHPHQNGTILYNSASLLHEGRIMVRYDKQILPNNAVFDEYRYFNAGTESQIVTLKGICCGLLICEDIWHSKPALQTKQNGAELLITLNASPFQQDKVEQRLATLKARHHETGLPICYANLVGGQDELLFDGGSLVMDQEGHVVAQADFFEEGLLAVTITKSDALLSFQAQALNLGTGLIRPTAVLLSHKWEKDFLAIKPMSEIERIYSALVLGTRDYLAKNNFKGALLGLSGGIDSALTLAIAVDAIGAENVEAIMMPSRHTSDLSYTIAKEQIEHLNVKYQIISIQALYENFLLSLQDQLPSTPNKTHENLQARCRGVLLMALSNQTGKIVLTTGNKSEMAVGYATLYGDMCGGFNPLKDVFKTQVYQLAEYRNRLAAVIPQAVIDRAPSAELAPNQTDQDTLPPYSILDAILKSYIEDNLSVAEITRQGFDIETIQKIVGMLNSNEYKRRQAAPGVRISKRAFGKDWRMPISKLNKSLP
jgi:NAD+ synthase (glutamine-hydrolysing)